MRWITWAAALAIAQLICWSAPAQALSLHPEGGWTPDLLWRGPKEMANAPLLVFRGLAGAADSAVSADFAGDNVVLKIVATPYLLATGAVVGACEGAMSMLGGIADTLTGGYFQVLPDDWSELSMKPIHVVGEQ